MTGFWLTGNLFMATIARVLNHRDAGGLSKAAHAFAGGAVGAVPWS
ncbi:hypothetical protein [Stenotrophomonas humi]|nr:hypothetical protein [Stenotrophomonas humi]